MRFFHASGAALAAALLVAGCGGGGNGNQSPAIKFTSMVTFGDSLSDVGSYRVGPIAAAGGGRFTINPVDPKTPTNWTELLSIQLGLSAPCAARTGGFGVTPSSRYAAGCRNYAQGGSRVTNPKTATNPKGTGDISGPLTEPVSTQIANYLADAGAANFSGSEIVTVMAGANDLLALMGELGAAATAAGSAAGAQAFGNSVVSQLAAGATSPATAAQSIGLAFQTEAARAGSTPTTMVGAAAQAAAIAGNTKVVTDATYVPGVAATAQAAATTAGAAAGAAYAAANGPANVPKMVTAAAELAGYIKTSIVGKGAKYVVVNNMPDVSTTPDGRANSAATQGLINAMVVAFNTRLQADLAGTPGIVFGDVYSEVTAQIADPAHFGLSNVTTKACTTNSSLTCTANTLVAGDSSRYLFADGVHPTPFGYKLLAQFVAAKLVLAGWI